MSTTQNPIYYTIMQALLFLCIDHYHHLSFLVHIVVNTIQDSVPDNFCQAIHLVAQQLQLVYISAYAHVGGLFTKK